MWDDPVAVWTDYLSKYDAALRLKSTALPEKDAAVWGAMRDAARSSDPPKLTHSAYVQLIDWKLNRGKRRPSLQAFAKKLTEDQVGQASEKALALLAANKPVGEILAPLLELKGCGPATASAVLALADDSLPFMSDELLTLAHGERKYTKTVYLALVEKVRKKALDLSTDNRKWTPRDVEKAAFSYLIHNPANPAVAKPASKQNANNVTDSKKKTKDNGKGNVGVEPNPVNKNGDKEQVNEGSSERGSVKPGSKQTATTQEDMDADEIIGEAKKDAEIDGGRGDTMDAPGSSRTEGDEAMALVKSKKATDKSKASKVTSKDGVKGGTRRSGQKQGERAASSRASKEKGPHDAIEEDTETGARRGRGQKKAKDSSNREMVQAGKGKKSGTGSNSEVNGDRQMAKDKKGKAKRSTATAEKQGDVRRSKRLRTGM